MADSEARAARAAALEEKKKRLEALKARRSTRAAAPPPPSTSTSDAAAAAAPSNLNEYIDGLLKTAAPVASSSSVEEEKEQVPAPAASEVAAPTAAAGAAAAPPTAEGAGTEARAPPAPAPPPPPVKKVETFTAGTQTEEDEFPPTLDDEEDEEKKDKGEEGGAEEVGAGVEDGDKSTQTTPARVLSAEERTETVSSEPFATFLNTASKKVERLLGAPVLADLLVDAEYGGGLREGEEEDEEGNERGGGRTVAAADDDETEQNAATRSDLVSSAVSYGCAKWTSTRDVTDLDWSPNHRELLLASYHMPSSSSASSSSGGGGGSAVRAVAPHDTPSSSLIPRSGELQNDGLALIWNLAMTERPEHIFTCGSPVLTSRFHPTERRLVVGGCHSGQIVVWDVRAGRLPVQRSTLATVASSTKGHSHPVCSMKVVEGESGLVTAATDGRMNFWSLANLRDPAESLMVGGNVSALAVAAVSNTVLCGDESGALRTVLASTGTGAAVQTPTTSRSSSSSSSRRAVRKLDAGDDGGEGHFGMVTGLSTKAVPRAHAGKEATRGISRGFLRGSAGLVLTSGVDWTTKLWAPAYTDKPLLSFLSHSYDYMCDVQWSPAHPSVFATASSNGSLGLWNLASSLDEPISGSDGILVDTDGASGRGLNKIKWSADGRRIAVACSDRLHVLGMSEEVWKPKGDEEARMMSHLTSRGILDGDKV